MSMNFDQVADNLDEETKLLLN